MTDALPEPPDLDPAALASSAFGRARKGFDPAEVNAALGRAADALRVWQLRDRQMRAELEVLEQRVRDSHELDEHRIASVLGEETARIVTAARDAAAEIRTKAEDQAARLLRETEESATRDAAALRSEATTLRDEAERFRTESETAAEQRLAEVESAAADLEADARRRHDELIAEAAGVLDLRTREAEAVASGLVEAAAAELSAAEVEAAGIRIAAEVAGTEERDRAREEGRAMVAEAKALRERMLADLAERRRTARRQIEGARAGRDRIVEVLRAAGADVAATIDGLEDIDDEIQRAADTAALQVDDDIDAVVAELEAELSTGSEATELTDADADTYTDADTDTDAAATVDADAAVDSDSEVVADTEADTETEADTDVVVDVTVVEDTIDVLVPDAAELATTTGVGIDDAEVDDTAESVAGEGSSAEGGIALVETVEVVETLTVIESESGTGIVDVVTTTDTVDLVDTTTGAVVELDVETDVRADVIGMFRGAEPDAGPDDASLAAGASGDEDLDDASDDDDEDDEEDVDEAAGATVHDLFARIRAEGLDDEDVTEEPRPEGDAVTAAVDATATATAAAEEPTGAPVSVATAVDEVGELLDRRDRALVPIEKQLSRSLRRLASDEQNEVLDQLRRLKRGRPDVDTVLADVEATRERFVDALLADFGAAVEAGSAFWAEVAGSSADALFDDEDRVRSVLADQLAEFLAVHRAHLERTFAEADEQGLDNAELGDRIRAGYRDWRSGSLGELAGDLATAGFAHGERVAAGPGTPWRWVVDNGGLPCADGEDNALAGVVACEEPFPTGDITPPAHAGCRCILLPAHR
ncbi:MAG: coiled-coil domain-containing protein [Microthrixaceae bacterium]